MPRACWARSMLFEWSILILLVLAKRLQATAVGSVNPTGSEAKVAISALSPLEYVFDPDFLGAVPMLQEDALEYAGKPGADGNKGRDGRDGSRGSNMSGALGPRRGWPSRRQRNPWTNGCPGPAGPQDAHRGSRSANGRCLAQPGALRNPAAGHVTLVLRAPHGRQSGHDHFPRRAGVATAVRAAAAAKAATAAMRTFPGMAVTAATQALAVTAERAEMAAASPCTFPPTTWNKRSYSTASGAWGAMAARRAPRARRGFRVPSPSGRPRTRSRFARRRACPCRRSAAMATRGNIGYTGRRGHDGIGGETEIILDASQAAAMVRRVPRELQDVILF